MVWQRFAQSWGFWSLINYLPAQNQTFQKTRRFFLLQTSAVPLPSIVDNVTHVGLQVPAPAILHWAFMTFTLKAAAQQSNPVISPEPSDFSSSSLPSLHLLAALHPTLGVIHLVHSSWKAQQRQGLLFHQQSTLHDSSIPWITVISQRPQEHWGVAQIPLTELLLISSTSARAWAGISLGERTEDFRCVL